MTGKIDNLTKCICSYVKITRGNSSDDRWYLRSRQTEFDLDTTESDVTLYLWRQVKLILVKDGSSQGAAFAASSALRQVANGVRCT